MRELQEQFDCGKKPDFHAQNTDIHTIASLFKLYLRTLPEPVIPWPHYQQFYDGIRLLCFSDADGRQELILQLAQLPRTNYNLLKYVCAFLHEVSTYESTNKMTIMNLATVFGPNIFRPKEESSATLMESTAMSQKFVHLLIENQEEMFPSNHLINFSPQRAEEVVNTPTPPPRSHKARPNQQPNIDLLKELKENLDNNPPPASRRSKADIMNHHSNMLISFDSDEDISQMMGRSSFAAVNKRAQSVDAALDLRNSMAFNDSTLADSSSSALEESGSTDGGGGHSTTNSHKPSFSEFQDVKSAIRNNTPGNRQSLVIFNPATSPPPLVIPRKDRPVSVSDGPKSPPPPVSPRKSKPSLPMDLTSTTPEVSNRQSMDVALQYSNMQEQVRSLKTELIEVKDDRDQRLLKMKMKCEGVQIKLLNEVKS